MADILEPKTMIQAIEQMPSAGAFLQETFFPNVETHNTRLIEVDVTKGGRRMAPYVSPVQEGKVIRKEGGKTSQIKLPYVKLKYDITAVESARRQPGENPYSARTPGQRAQSILGKRLLEGKRAVARTVEVQAAQALVHGKVICQGTDESEIDWSVELDFGRDPANTITLAAGDYWTAPGVNPLDDLRTWRIALFKTSGYRPDVVVMGTDVMNAFLSSASVQALLDNRRMALGQVDMKPTKGTGATYIGAVEGLELYHYVDWYEDPLTGALTEMIPANALVMGSREAANAVNYGAIVDLDFPGGPIERKIFPKTWADPDPSILWLLLQSSPLATLAEPDSTQVVYPVA